MNKSEWVCLLGPVDYFEKHIQVCLDPLWCFPTYPVLCSIWEVASALRPIRVCAETYTEHHPGCLVTRCNSSTVME